MEIRKIIDSERVEILKGAVYAYDNYGNWQDNWQSQEAIALIESIIPNQNLAVFVNGKVASALANYSFQQSVRGVIKEMGGVGGVWTYPEYRNRGYVRALMTAAFADMKANGQAVSMLIPFRQSFYKAFGYVTANANLELKVPTASLSSNFKDQDQDGVWQLQRINGDEITEALLNFMVAVASQQWHGLTLPVYMTRSQWHLRMKDQLGIMVKRHGELVALATYTIDARTTERKMRVSNFFWRDLESRMKLLNFFGKHRDQIHYVDLDLPFGTNFYQWFGDVMTPYDLKITIPPYMVRVVDVGRAIADLPASLTGEIIMAISDPACAWNNHTFKLQALEGKLSISHSPDLKPQVQATIEGISALVYGTLPLMEIEQRQWLILSENSDDFSENWRSLLENWFPVTPIYNTLRF